MWRVNMATLNPIFVLAPELDSDTQVTYEDISHSKNAKWEDLWLLRVKKWFDDLVRPSDLSDADYATFVRYSSEFFLDSGNLWRKDLHGAHKIVATPDRRLEIIRAAHDDIGHKMIFTTKLLITLCFLWLNMKADIVWFIQTCPYCQLWQMRNLLICKSAPNRDSWHLPTLRLAYTHLQLPTIKMLI